MQRLLADSIDICLHLHMSLPWQFDRAGPRLRLIQYHTLPARRSRKAEQIRSKQHITNDRLVVPVFGMYSITQQMHATANRTVIVNSSPHRGGSSCTSMNRVSCIAAIALCSRRHTGAIRSRGGSCTPNFHQTTRVRAPKRAHRWSAYYYPSVFASSHGGI